jgi:glycosyltransferase involved in cell wall biosynthesis
MNHYCADDLKFLRVCKNKIWTWGYLTAVPMETPRIRDNCKTQIMWCGRMLAWKQVDHFLQAVKQTIDMGCKDLNVGIIGDGEEKNNLKTLAMTLGLNKWVNFYPFMQKEKIRKKMQTADIYVFPSNRKEGWGAVLPEAMSEGCVVIANREAGSTLELVQHGKNGFVYENGNIHELASLIKYCCEKPAERRLLSLEAWKTMRNWSPEEGANRLIQLTGKLSDGESPFVYKSGLCSSRQKD